jgi:hypothetical protein
VAVQALRKEIVDEKKATWKYMPESGSEYSFEHLSDERKQKLLGVAATNDEAESVLGGATANIQCYGRISLCGASAASDVKRNNFLNRPTASTKAKKPLGMFHGLDKDIGTMIFETAMKDAPTTLCKNSEAIERLNKVRREKEELIAKRHLESANEDYIDAVYYLSIYTSLACWKGDKRVVTKELGKLSSESAKYNALKENILI